MRRIFLNTYDDTSLVSSHCLLLSSGQARPRQRRPEPDSVNEYSSKHQQLRSEQTWGSWWGFLVKFNWRFLDLWIFFWQCLSQHLYLYFPSDVSSSLLSILSPFHLIISWYWITVSKIELTIYFPLFMFIVLAGLTGTWAAQTARVSAMVWSPPMAGELSTRPPGPRTAWTWTLSAQVWHVTLGSVTCRHVTVRVTRVRGWDRATWGNTRPLSTWVWTLVRWR